MYRIITVEREYGSGGGEIACELAKRLGWKVWDHALTQEIAKVANVECSTVERCEERVDGTFQRLVKVFWRGSHERSIPLPGAEPFDTDRFVAVGEQVMEKSRRGRQLRDRGPRRAIFSASARRRLPRFSLCAPRGEAQPVAESRQERERSRRVIGHDRPRSNHLCEALFRRRLAYALPLSHDDQYGRRQ